MFDVQKAGLGAAKGIPSIIVAAASFDDMVAITGYSLFSNLAIRSEEGGLLGWQLAKGPLDIVFGLVGGFAIATFCSFTAIWNTRGKRCAAVLLSGARQLLPKGRGRPQRRPHAHLRRATLVI